MDHPLLAKQNSDLRQRVIQHLKTGCSVKKSGDLIFVCGGNDGHHMRSKFSDYCASRHPQFKLFRPEHAISNYLSEFAGHPFDLGKFELAIADMSHAIVLFPEGPGSFAEVGYFSQHADVRRKTILVLDEQYQGKKIGFIGLGPAKQFGEFSEFGEPVQLSYETPNFELIVDRVTRIPLPRYRRNFTPENYGSLPTYEKMSLAYKIVDLLGHATEDVIIFIMKGMFGGNRAPASIRDVLSVLKGSHFLGREEEYGNYYVENPDIDFLPPRPGKKDDEGKIRLAVSDILNRSDGDFPPLVRPADAA